MQRMLASSGERSLRCRMRLLDVVVVLIVWRDGQMHSRLTDFSRELELEGRYNTSLRAKAIEKFCCRYPATFRDLQGEEGRVRRTTKPSLRRDTAKLRIQNAAGGRNGGFYAVDIALTESESQLMHPDTVAMIAR